MSDFHSALETVRQRALSMDAFGKRIKFQLDEHVMLVDGTQTPPRVSEGEGEAGFNLTIKVSLANFHSLLNKDIAPWTAFRKGMIRLQGEMTAATALQKIF